MDGNIQKYIAFLKTVELQSFTKAAAELAYAQSSVSKMVADLEKEWNVVLLERDRKGVHLTTAGEQILPYIRTLTEDYLHLENQINDMNGLQTGVIRIGTFSSVAIHWLPNIVAEFQKDYPMLQYELLLGDYDEIERWIDEGRVDCGFLRFPTGKPYETILLKRDEYKVVLPKGHPLADKKAIAMEDLEEQPFILLEHGGKTEVSELLDREGVHPEIRFTTWEDYAIMAMVEKGLGIGILPDIILQRIPYQLEIRSLSKPFYREICLAFKERKLLSAATERFLDYLKYREDAVF